MQSKILPALVIIALSSVALFGFFGMGVMEDGGAHSCLFAFAGNACAMLQSTIAVAAHYLDMIGWLFGALASFDVFVLIFFLFFLLALFVVLALFHIAPPEKPRLSIPLGAGELFVKEKHAFHRWLSYHNKRDPHALARVHPGNLGFRI